MSRDLEKWLQFIENDPILSEKLLKSKTDYEQKHKSFKDFIVDKFIPEAKKYGFNFSFDDVVTYSSENGLQNLSIEDLQDVAGGSIKAILASGAVAMSLLATIPVTSVFFGNKKHVNNDLQTVTTSDTSNREKTLNYTNTKGTNYEIGQMLRQYVKSQDEVNNKTDEKKTNVANDAINIEGINVLKKATEQEGKSQNDETKEVLIKQLQMQIQDLQKQLSASKQESDKMINTLDKYKVLVENLQKELSETKHASQNPNMDLTVTTTDTG